MSRIPPEELDMLFSIHTHRRFVRLAARRRAWGFRNAKRMKQAGAKQTKTSAALFHDSFFRRAMVAALKTCNARLLHIATNKDHS